MKTSQLQPTLPDGMFKQSCKLCPVAGVNIPSLGDARIIKIRTLESLFDEIMDGVQRLPLNQAIESILQPVFEAQNIYFWFLHKELNMILSPTLNKQIQTEGNTISEAISSNKIIYSNDQSSLTNYNEEIDGKILDPRSSVLFIPMRAKDGTIRAVVQISRQHDNPFLDQDRAIANYLINKFKIYSNYIFNDKNFFTDAIQLVSSDDLNETIKKVSKGLSDFFKAKKIEFWQKKSNIYVLYTETSEEPIFVSEQRLGIVSTCLNELTVINERVNKNGKNYLESVDGPSDEPSLFVPYKSELEEGFVWAIVLRGRINPPYFTKSDESQLLALAPFALKSIEANLSYFGSSQYQSLEERLKTLLEVAETLTGVLDIDNLIPTIMSRACSLLNASRCSLFIVDKAKQILVSYFHGGLKEALKVPLSKGIVGYTATTGKVVNIEDAYSDPRFDRSYDASTGFRTMSLLTVPIYNNRGEITGVTEMINKTDGNAFDEDDIRMMTAFNVFCGTSLDNAKLYKASLDLTSQLRTFMEMSNTLNSQNNLQSVLQGILENARSIVSGSVAILFSFNTNDGSLSKIVSVGEEVKGRVDTTFAQQCVTSRETRLFSRDDISRMKQNAELSSTIETILASTDSNALNNNNNNNNKIRPTSSRSSARVSAVWTNDNESSKLNKEGNSVTNSLRDLNATNSNFSICCIPLMNSEQMILGVMQLSCNWKVTTEDLKLLESFAVFAAVSLERTQLKELATRGKAEIDLDTWIMPQERDIFDKPPMKFILPKVTVKQFWTVNFDAPAWDGIGHIRVIFSIFYKFKLLQEFKVTNEKFFRFLTEIRDTYKKVPYHNWRHAVDVTQFVTYELLISRFDQHLTKFELFGLLVSAVCHDANHDGFTNVYNVKAETPLGILFKNQSVMETHHCQVAINVISKEETNIFEIFQKDEYKKMWGLIISLILSTDMARHFDIINTFNNLKDTESFNMTITEHRILIMQIILKCADISNVARPFELADKWCDVLCEEFFRQGDLERANGMEFTSPNNDREHLDKPKSQIGFYTFVCLPLFQTAARAIPALQCNVDQVSSNLNRWKAAQEEATKDQSQT